MKHRPANQSLLPPVHQPGDRHRADRDERVCLDQLLVEGGASRRGLTVQQSVIHASDATYLLLAEACDANPKERRRASPTNCVSLSQRAVSSEQPEPPNLSSDFRKSLVADLGGTLAPGRKIHTEVANRLRNRGTYLPNPLACCSTPEWGGACL